MVRTRAISGVLWSLALASCGRYGFATPRDTTDAGADAELAPSAMVAASLDLVSECGVAVPPTLELAVANTGTGDLVVQQATATGGFACTTALPMTIPPGATAMLEIAPPAAVIGTDLGGSIKTGALTLVTNEPGALAHTVALTASVVGANLAVTDMSGMPVSLTFSASGGGCPFSQFVQLTNTGNSPAMVNGVITSDFRLGGFASGALAADTSSSANVRPYTTLACNGSETITYAVTGSVCTTTPVALQATFAITGAASCFCT